MTTSDDKLRQELTELIAKRQVAVIVGSGVSVATTGRCQTADWIGLLKSGIQ